ncbi:MAG: glycosyltransferase [Arachnia sp.]
MKEENEGSLSGSRVAVTVAIPTYKRPELLDRLLTEVEHQAEVLAGLTQGSVDILVADNDPEGSAQATVAQHPGVTYLPVSTPGIAAVRSACLGAARGDVIQFIDDDEQPEKDWLVTMVSAWHETGRPAALAGSVVARFDTPPSDWIDAGQFFERRRPATGTVLPVAPAGNLLLDARQVRKLGVDFDARLGLRGGEDTLFTTQLTAAGGQIRFCREGIIYDLVPDDRNRREWVLKRAWHQGATKSTIALWDVRGLKRVPIVARLVVGGVGRAAAGTGLALLGRVTGSLARDARGTRLARRGLGIAAGALKPDRGEYHRPGDGAAAGEQLAGPVFGERLRAALTGARRAHADLGVVVVNYGASSLLERNLPEGLGASAGARIAVVDNYTTAEEREKLRRLATERDWILVEPDGNLGFGEGVNAGVLAAAESGCRSFVTLNPDAQADADVLIALKSAVEEHGRAMVSPHVVSSDGRLQFRGSTVSLRDGRMRSGWIDGDDDPEWKNWLTGACLAFSGETFAELGGFAEEYFLYWEDVDLSRRAADLGIELVLRPDLRVVHDEGGTHTDEGSRAKSPVYYYYNARNRLIFGARFAPAEYRRAWLRDTPRESLRIWLRGGRRQLLTQPRGAVQTVRGAVDGIKGYRRLTRQASLTHE